MMNCAKNGYLTFLPNGICINQSSSEKNETHIILRDFEIQTDHRIPPSRMEKMISNKEKENQLKSGHCHTSEPQNENQRKWRESFDLDRDLKTCDLGTILKGLVKGLDELEIGGRAGTIQTTVLLKLVCILRRVLETWRH